MLRTREVDAPRRADGTVDLERLTAAVGAVTGRPAWLLESAPGEPGALGWSALALGSSGRLVVPPVGPDGSPDPFARLDRLCDRLGLDPTADRAPDQPPADGGLLGAVSYDAVRAVERLPAAAAPDLDVPSLDVLVADVVLLVDHLQGTTTLVHRPLPRERSPAELTGLADRLRRAVASARVAGDPPPLWRTPGVRTTLSAASYRAAVAAVLERIAAGDTFQVNLAQRISSRWPHGLHDLYRVLRDQSPAPYGAALPTHGAGLAAISPETFLEVRGGVATVRPIKGTRARRPEDPAADAAAGRALTESAKDRAENVMVVDLERNDLGRVCRPGTVEVPRLLDLEAHPTVWHLVSEVTGVLRPGTTWGDLLRATFPCGSVTGAPKVSSMAIIDHLEPVRRGWYCGSFGWLGAGAGSTAVAIRTAVLGPNGHVHYSAGGGIVAESDPGAEHLESLDKAAAFLRAVGADGIG